MTINYTPKLGLAQPTDGDTSWGNAVRGNQDALETIINTKNLAHNQNATTGLTFGYHQGVVSIGNKVASLSKNTITLQDDAVNFIEVYIDEAGLGIVSLNVTDFTFSRIPLFKVTTSVGAITQIDDMRTFIRSSSVANTTRSFSYFIGDVLTVTDKATMLAPINLNLTSVYAYVNTAPTGADLIIDILVNDVSIGTVTILMGTKDNSATLDAAIVENDKVGIKISQVGSTVSGEDLSVSIKSEEVQ